MTRASKKLMTLPIADIHARASAMRRFSSIQTHRAERVLCARRRHSSIFLIGWIFRPVGASLHRWTGQHWNAAMLLLLRLIQSATCTSCPRMRACRVEFTSSTLSE
jgi:hypothetical protein